ncbi:hypothetical protein EV702DRAFT_1179099 [Suillus placidus]|uniref:Uncharacterized protein n=1 Tax=Suillus placidus TaxID=48579 RepID=A0A9P6ZWK3_9AGAM|nr:hypothetical protein EV702DRAFT_1179099 [Suillus placidus]
MYISITLTLVCLSVYAPLPGYVPTAVGNSLLSRQLFCISIPRLPVGRMKHGEWELARFLVENLNQTQIDKFLKLKWFNTRLKPSFTSKDQLLDWMDVLPCYKTIHPIQLIWRDALEVVKQLFSDHLPCATQVPIILGSDKTPVTRTTGGLEMHPIFITIGNLDSETWLWHKCVDLVCANLKLAAKTGCFMSNPSKFISYAFMPLVGHVCDLPEASMIAAVSKNVSPLTMAIHENFNDGVLYPPCTGQHTLQLICEISKTIDPWDLDKFQKAAKAVYLSGIHMPYWHDWMFACPSVFLAGEVLHTCLKFFTDHPLNWIKEIRVGTRHFTKGITHVNQMTGREHRDIQRTIVASIAGAAPPRFICTICALIEFIYLAQNPSMMQALSNFHLFKDAIIETQARRGKKGAKKDFFIPKLELLQSFRGTVERLGTLMQFSVDMTECLLITHCKDLFIQTNRRVNDFMEQSVWILNRQESMELFNLYALFRSRHLSLVNVICTEDEAVTTGILSGDALTAFHLTLTPDLQSLSPINIHTTYLLINFDHALSQFIRRFSLSTGEHTRWDNKYGHFCAVIQTYPPGGGFPLGNCDNVLVNVIDNILYSASHVAQVRLIFQPKIPRASDLVLPSYLSCPLLYVQYFDFIASPNDRPELTMWTVECSYVEDQHVKCRCGGVVPLMSVTHTVKLIPDYGTKVDEKISSAICLESYDHFFLNNFADKESYHTLSMEFT